MSRLFNLSRWHKRLLMLSLDMLLLPLAVWASFALRLGSWNPRLDDGVWLLILAPVIAIPLFIRLGLYRAILRFISGHQAIVAVLKGITICTLTLAFVTLLADWKGIPRSVYPIFWGTAFFFIGGSRYAVRQYYARLQRHNRQSNIIIYGAGESGIQLATSMSNHPDYQPIAYLDDDKKLQRSIIQGLPIYDPKSIPLLIEKFGVQQVLLALPSITKKRTSEILALLESYPVHVLSIPGLSELMAGEKKIDDIREIEVDELLGRDAVAPDSELLSACITGLSIMVTGAGGSIGSEICRQIIILKPAKLILFDSSEYALYAIEAELNKLIKQHGLQREEDWIIPVLGSVQNQDKVLETLYEYDIETLYHAAAYKHVPLVEQNPLEGITNNTFGTLRTALAAKAAGVRNFVLISTDKAVRPTNVMGASKRIAELVLQGLALNSKQTIFSMVRFGNVLGSSGSVVPLFRKQIHSGGPLTVTHPEMTRYFMTIPEAAQLVIQSGAMARGGEVFLLDMGEPVKIIDLARRMINLSGRTVSDKLHPEGDIEIQISGLRQGEKLYEELLIDSQAEPTGHPRIYLAREKTLEWDELIDVLDELEAACEQRNPQRVQKLLENTVAGFKGQVKSIKLPTHLLMQKQTSPYSNITYIQRPEE